MNRMNKPRWFKRKAHEKAKCWERTVHNDVPPGSVRICPHGVAYTIWRNPPSGKHAPDRSRWEWRAIDDFFIESGIYDW